MLLPTNRGMRFFLFSLYGATDRGQAQGAHGTRTQAANTHAHDRYVSLTGPELETTYTHLERTILVRIATRNTYTQPEHAYTGTRLTHSLLLE